MQKITYLKVEELFSFEFCFLITDESIEVLAIDHANSQTRTLGFCSESEEAEFILETCIQFGFQERGMFFKGIPGYQLVKQREMHEVQ